MLYAFRQGFYARLGYAPTPSRKRLSFDPRSVPAAWRALAAAHVRGARGPDGAGIRNAYARAAAQRTGWLQRPKLFWEMLLARERRHVLVCDAGDRRRGPITGYVAFTLEQEHAHGETTLVVDELVADDDVSRRALLGGIGAMRDQVAEAVLEVTLSDPIELALVDPDRRRFGTENVEHALGEVVGGPMVRLEDVPRALEARGYPADGGFDVVLTEEDPDDASEAIALGVRIRSGRAEVGPARGGGVLRTTRAGLGAITYGGLLPSRAVALGLAEVERVAPLRLDAILALPADGPIDAF